MTNNNVMSAEIITLRDLLVTHHVIRDPSPLEDVLARFRRNIVNNKSGYELSSLMFYKCESMSHIRPADIRPSKAMPLEIKLGVSVSVDNDYSFNNIQSMCINIEYEAQREVVTFPGGVEVRKNKTSHGSWHLDYHSEKEQTSLAHPLYHFHHGGKKMYGHGDYGDVMILDAPRVAHPPLDLVLAIDFVISNFMEREWAVLSGVTEYRSLLCKAQERWWKDYYLNVASYWGAPLISGKTSKELKYFARKILPSLPL